MVALVGNDMGLLGSWVFQNLSLIVFLLVPVGLAHWVFFLFLASLGSFKACFLFYSSTLPMCYCVLFLVLYGYLFTLGSRSMAPLFFLLFPRLSFLSLDLIWAFLPLSLCY